MKYKAHHQAPVVSGQKREAYAGGARCRGAVLYQSWDTFWKPLSASSLLPTPTNGSTASGDRSRAVPGFFTTRLLLSSYESSSPSPSTPAVQPFETSGSSLATLSRSVSVPVHAVCSSCPSLSCQQSELLPNLDSIQMPASL